MTQINNGPVFVWLTRSVMHTLSSSDLFIYLFIYLVRELSLFQVVHGEDWVPVSGRVGHFARGLLL